MSILRTYFLLWFRKIIFFFKEDYQKKMFEVNHLIEFFQYNKSVAIERILMVKVELYSQLTLCAKWTCNVHYYRTYKEHRNLRIRKHVTTSCSGTKPFYQLWAKGFDVRRRDTIFYAVLFIWPPTRAAPIGRTFASRLRAPKIDPSRLASSARLLFSSNSHSNFRVLPVRDVTRTLSPSIVSDCYDIWVTPPSARAHPR